MYTHVQNPQQEWKIALANSDIQYADTPNKTFIVATATLVIATILYLFYHVLNQMRNRTHYAGFVQPLWQKFPSFAA